MKRRLVLLGPPASGKGTQGQLIREKFKLAAPSPGAILRDELKAKSELGVAAGKFANEGRLVPDELIVQLVRRWLDTHNGSFIFDGFPRTIGQADAFEEVLEKRQTPLDTVLSLEADQETIERRISRRVVCSICESSFSIGFHVESVDSPCPRCGGDLQRRRDDAPEILKARLEEYRQKTEPLVAYYDERGLLNRIDANRSPGVIFADIVHILSTNDSD